MKAGIATAKIAVVMAVAALSASSATAAMTCPEGSAGIFRFKVWIPPTPSRGSLKGLFFYDNNTNKVISLTRGRIYFGDILGASIGSVDLEPDQRVFAGARAGTHVDISKFPRLEFMDPKHVEAIVCVTGVVYSDGTKETF